MIGGEDWKVGISHCYVRLDCFGMESSCSSTFEKARGDVRRRVCEARLEESAL